jgi:hypothetical protein
VINASSANQDLIPVTFFSTTANYSVGNFVVQAGQLYRATQAVSAGAFNASQWTQVGGSVSVGDTLPTNPQPGGLWWDSVGGQLYVYYNDGNTTQWVPATNLAGAATLTTSDTPPVTPKAGDMWFDSVGGQLYIYFNDGTSLQWVIANNFNGGLYLPLNGVTNGSDAAAGQIGEVISSVITAPVTLTTGAPANVTSVSLTAGDWDVQGEIWIAFGAGGGNAVQGAINNASAIIPSTITLGTSRGAITGPSFSASSTAILPPGACRVSLSAMTTYYLVAMAGFPSGTTTAMGKIWARRVR